MLSTISSTNPTPPNSTASADRIRANADNRKASRPSLFECLGPQKTATVLLNNIYRAPVSGVFRGLWRKPGQHFAWCVPRRSRLEGQSLRAHDNVLLSQSHTANRKGRWTRNVSKGLVDGNPLTRGVKSLSTLMAASPSRLEMPADKDQLWTQLTGPPSRHTATDSK